MTLLFKYQIILDISKLRHSGVLVKGKYPLLDKSTKGQHYNGLFYPGKAISKPKMIVECKYVNHLYSLKLSMRKYGHNINFHPSHVSKNLEEPITLAYI